MKPIILNNISEYFAVMGEIEKNIETDIRLLLKNLDPTLHDCYKQRLLELVDRHHEIHLALIDNEDK